MSLRNSSTIQSLRNRPWLKVWSKSRIWPMCIDEKWQKRQENGPFRVPASLSLAQSLSWLESGTRNRFTQSKYRLGAADGFPVHHSSPVASKCDFWTKLLTKASNRAPTGRRHPNGPCGQSNHSMGPAGTPAGNNYLRQAVGRG